MTELPLLAAVPSSPDRHTWAGDVAAILDALPATQADMLRLLYFERLTDREAAAQLGVSVRRARTAAADGMRHLAETLLVLPAV